MPRFKVSMKLGAVVFTAVAMAAGFGAATFQAKHEAKRIENQLRVEIASIRTYAESYALRHGHFPLLPNSCHSADAWQQLGRPAPPPDIGCFEIAASPTASTPVASTGETMVIIASSPKGDLQGFESADDSRPTWVRHGP